MPRKRWLIGLVVLLAAVSAGVYFWRVPRPPAPPAARLPASARVLLAPFHKESFDLTVEAHQDLDYRVGMQAGATLVYAWSTAHSGETLSYQLPGQKSSRGTEGHGAFEAQSSGWYRWRWKNESGNPITIHVKLNGYYEAASMPYDK